MSRTWPIILAVMLVLSGCVVPATTTPAEPGSTPATTAPPGTLPPTSAPETAPPETVAPRDEQPQASEADLASVVAGNTRFAVELYRLLRQADGNLFYSPYSISQALAMTYAGAREQTAAQMADVLGIDLDEERLHATMNALDQLLASRAEDLGYQEGTGFRLEVANALWGQKGYAFRGEFLDLLARSYGAGMHTVDYASDPEAARKAINDWVLAQTEDRIRDLLAPGTVDEATRLVLANAIYMKASWQSPFDPDDTADGSFTLPNGDTVTVPMMHQTSRYGLLQGGDLVVVELPYIGDQLRMTILMPAVGTLGAFEEALDADRLPAIIDSLEWSDVRLTMPTFRVESEYSLADALKALGMTDAFDPDAADFSGMDGTRDLYISAVVHKAFVDVDETGTEAAAATAVAMTTSAMPGEPPEVAVDHPFLFLIRDQVTGAILFIGRVVDPS